MTAKNLVPGRDYMNTGHSSNQLQAIGCVVVSHSALHLSMNQHIGLILKVLMTGHRVKVPGEYSAQGSLAVTSEMDFLRSCKTLDGLIREFALDDSKLSQFKALRERLLDSNKNRNALVHGLHAHPPGGGDANVLQFKYRIGKRAAPRSELWPVARIWELAKEIFDVERALNKFIFEIAFDQ